MSLLLLDAQLTLQFCFCLIDQVQLSVDSTIILHNTFQIPTNCTYEQLLASATVTVDFRKFFSVSCEVLGLTRIPLSGENVYHDSVSVIVPRFTSFTEDFLLCCCQVTILFWSQNRSLLVFCGSKHEHCASVCVSPLLKRHLPNMSSLFQSNVRAQTPPGPLDELWWAVTKQECLALALMCSSRVFFFVLVQGFPHTRLALRVATASDDVSDSPEELDWSFRPDVEAELLLEEDDNTGTKRGTGLSIIQIIVFPFGVDWGVSTFSTHMNIRVLSKAHEATESLAFHRLIALLRTDRDHERKLVFTRWFALSPGRGKSHMVVSDLLKMSIVSQLKSPCSTLCIEAPGCTINILSLWRLHKRIKRSFVLGLELKKFLAKFHAALLVQSACREVSSSGCSSELGAHRFRSWSSHPQIMPPDCHFLSRIHFCTSCILRISGVSRRSVQTQFFKFPLNRIHWCWVSRQHWTFFSFRIAAAPWVPSSRPRAEVALTIRLSTVATIAINASVSRLVTTTHGMMSMITRRYFSSCPPET